MKEQSIKLINNLKKILEKPIKSIECDENSYYDFIELQFDKDISIVIEVYEDNTFNWFILNIGKYFNDLTLNQSIQYLSDDLFKTYIGEGVNIDTFIDINGDDQTYLFKNFYTVSRKLKKCIKCKNWYDIDENLNISLYDNEIYTILKEHKFI